MAYEYYIHKDVLKMAEEYLKMCVFNRIYTDIHLVGWTSCDKGSCASVAVVVFIRACAIHNRNFGEYLYSQTVLSHMYTNFRIVLSGFNSVTFS